MKYNYLDLFHGIGGFAFAAYLAGMRFKNHLCSDIEPWCQKLYKLRFPNSVQLGDIMKIDTEDLKNKYGTEWIITGGFPCQDISIAGKGKGLIDENGNKTRSGLWFEYWRIIMDLRPRFAIMENVAALTFRGLDAVLGSLAEIRYDAVWQSIRASDMGAPHKRERIWIVAYPASGKSGQPSEWEGRESISGGSEKGNMADTELHGYLHRQNGIKSTNRRQSSQCDISAKSKMANSAESGLSQSQTEKQQERLLYAKRGSSEIPDSLIQHDDNSGHGTSEIFRERSCETEIQGQLSDSECDRLQRKRTEYDGTRQTRLCDRKTGWPATDWKLERSIRRVAHELSERLDRLK